MRVGKIIIKWVLYFLLTPTSYIVAALILSSLTVDRKANHENTDNLIYLNTNGVHLDIVLSKSDVDSLMLNGIIDDDNSKYLSFGWGDENFYINTPTWGDLTVNTACKAMFLNSSTLLHLTRYNHKQSDWVEVKVSDLELKKLNAYLLNTFKVDSTGKKILLKNQGYSFNDDFYKAKGNYSCINTCNNWVNNGFKKCGLKSCVWSPFDFGLLNKYR